ncbi:unnamed protein product, partial [Pleuronectes platessa]
MCTAAIIRCKIPEAGGIISQGVRHDKEGGEWVRRGEQVTEEVTLDSNNQQQMSRRRKTLQEHSKRPQRELCLERNVFSAARRGAQIKEMTHKLGAGVDWPSGIPGIVPAQRALTVLSITTQTRVGRDLIPFWGGSRDGLLLRQKLKMDNKSKKRPGGAEKHREKKPKSLEVEAAPCAKLTDLFGAGFTSPAAAGAPGDERGGLDNDERVEADM